METLTGDLIVSTLNALRGDIQGVRDKQDVLSDSLHNVVQHNSTSLLLLTSRVDSIEHHLKTKRKRSIQAAGMVTAVGGIIGAAVKACWSHYKP
jgi:hypothetical protein